MALAGMSAVGTGRPERAKKAEHGLIRARSWIRPVTAARLSRDSVSRPCPASPSSPAPGSSSSRRPTATSSCARRRREPGSPTSARRSETRCGFHSLESRSRKLRPAAGGPRSSSSHPRFRCPAPSASRVTTRSRRPSTSSRAPASPVERQTILVAGGLARRLGKRELEHLVSPDFARRFRGRVEVHDAERPDLVDLGYVGTTPLRVNPALVETDVVVTVTAAETVLHGGPAALVGAAGSEAVRASGADSLLETAGSQGWDIGIALERALQARVSLVGASLVLHHPRFVGALHGYPYDPDALERIVRSPLRRVFGALPGALRMSVLRSLGAEIRAAGAFSGPPSVAHAEALLRAIDFRSAALEGQLDAIFIGIPHTTPYVPRERPNPVQAAYLGLGLALRLWRDAFPITQGRDRGPVAPLPQGLRPADSGSLPSILPGPGRGAGARRARAARARRGCRRSGAPGLPRRPHVPPAPAVRRLGCLPARARPARSRAHCGLP